MRYFSIIICFLSLSYLASAQAPQRMSYQTVIRNASNVLVSNSPIGVRLSLVQGDPSGSAVYAETHTTNSNANGLITVEFGSGEVENGSFSSVDWSNGPWFISSEIDLSGGTNYQFSSSQQLLSVPYALHSNTADSLAGGYPETDPLFSSSLAAGISAADTAYWNQKQNQLIAGTGITISGDTIRSSWREVGEHFGGGIVISVWMENNEQHGLIVSVSDLGNVQWSNVVNTVIGVSAQSQIDGIANTQAIIGQDGHVSSAAQLCADYTVGVYDDWYLPALIELELLNRAYLQVQTSTASTEFATLYWSSTEYELPLDPWILATSAYQMVMGYGETTPSSKDSYGKVRAFRRF